jgi:beta-glucosidase
MAATWDKELILKVATAISDEGRAKYHAALTRNGYTDQYQGLTFWSPNVNIFRDPRWGRGQETWGEDPFLTGRDGGGVRERLAGRRPQISQSRGVRQTLRGPFGTRKGSPSLQRRCNQTRVVRHLPARLQKTRHRSGKVESVMGAYNRTLSEVCCASQLLIEDILRGEWGFQGHYVSDCMALSDFHLNHKVTKDAAESAALALKHGCDLGCDHVFNEIPEAIAARSHHRSRR